MKHRHLLLISAMLLLGQVAFAQAGKQIITISHQYVNEPGCHEEATFEYDGHGRLLHARTLDYDDLGDENLWVTDYDYSGVPSQITSTTQGIMFGYTVYFYAHADLTANRVTEITIKQEVPLASYSSTGKMTLEYDALGRIAKSWTTDDDGDNDESIIGWEDGNPVTATETGHDETNISTYIFDLSKPAPRSAEMCYMLMGMPIDVTGTQVLMGMYNYMGYTPKNLVIGEKHTRNGGTTSERNFVYGYDADGDISSIEIYKDGKLTDTYNLGLTAAGVQEVEVEKSSSPFYTLQGYQTSAPRKGTIYIRNGRKVVSK